MSLSDEVARMVCEPGGPMRLAVAGKVAALEAEVADLEARLRSLRVVIACQVRRGHLSPAAARLADRRFKHWRTAR